jgi:hypothetical protein
MSTTALTREFLQITQESSFGTAATAVRGTNQIVIRLPGSNQQTMRANPVVQNVPYGGGFSVIKDTVSDKTELKGTITTPLFYTQAAFLLGWACQRINSGQTSPWTTTEPATQFASCTLDHAIMYDDNGTFVRKRYTGVKVDGFKIEISDESQYAMLTLDVIAGDYAGNTYDSSSDPSSMTAPVPSDSDFPTDFVLWIHSNAGFTLGGGTRAEYTSLALSGQNQSDVRYYANRFVQVIRSFGSMYSIDADLTLISSPDDRATYQTLGALTSELVFTNGTHTITLDLKTNNRIKGLTDDTQLGKIYGRKLSLENRYDSANSAWFAFSFA